MTEERKEHAPLPRLRAMRDTMNNAKQDAYLIIGLIGNVCMQKSPTNQEIINALLDNLSVLSCNARDLLLECKAAILQNEFTEAEQDKVDALAMEIGAASREITAVIKSITPKNK